MQAAAKESAATATVAVILGIVAAIVVCIIVVVLTAVWFYLRGNQESETETDSAAVPMDTKSDPYDRVPRAKRSDPYDEMVPVDDSSPQGVTDYEGIPAADHSADSSSISSGSDGSDALF
jgi:hypothetical protein